LEATQAPAKSTDGRREILRVAEKIFARKGYGATTTREIAEAAGVTKGLLFYHFQTKERLYLSVIDNMVKELGRLATPPSGEGIDHMAHVRRFIDGWTDFFVEHRDFQKLITRELMDEGQFHKKIIDEYLKPLYEIGISFIRKGIDAGAFRPMDPATVVQMLTSVNSMYFISSPLHEQILGENPIAPPVLARRQEELWAHFFRALQQTT
jgi:TetR/AcrR family transcriptional regulator